MLLIFNEMSVYFKIEGSSIFLKINPAKKNIGATGPMGDLD